MKSKIEVKCSCGKEWFEDNTPEVAQSWWEVLKIADPELVAAIEERGGEKTVDLALRLVWARHSLYRQGKGDKNTHEAIVTEHITIETIEEAQAMQQEPESEI